MPTTASGGWRRWIGLAAGPGLWAVTTQAKYAVAQTACPDSSGLVTLAVAAVTAILVLAAGAVLRRAWDWAGAKGDANSRFLAALSALSALLFAVSVLLQGAAGFDPWVVLPLALSWVLYSRGTARLWRRATPGRGVPAWRAACFATGWAALLLALLPPLRQAGHGLFTAHMVEHGLLMVYGRTWAADGLWSNMSC